MVESRELQAARREGLVCRKSLKRKEGAGVCLGRGLFQSVEEGGRYLLIRGIGVLQDLNSFFPDSLPVLWLLARPLILAWSWFICGMSEGSEGVPSVDLVR